ncbi:hypothetical protein IAD21_03755 [Abditibacteriota bacterium]|nr:hypothetical protein IAD21_03755 [Abditibacteriota bacterium]
MSVDAGALDERVQHLLSRFGAAACGAELVYDGDLCGHITAAARIWNPDRTRVLQVWSAKNERWQLPGAHGESDLDLEKIARREARRALGLSIDAEPDGSEVAEVNVKEIAEYWNTPAHVHLEIVFEFQSEERAELPRGARWFDVAETW